MNTKEHLIKAALSFSIILSWGSANATSLGRIERGVIVNIDRNPAICVPKDARETMPVGWISITESYVRNAESWALELKLNAKPLVLKPGDCIIYGLIPNGYEYPKYKQKVKNLSFKENRTYSFQINHAYRLTDVYKAIFCTSQTEDGPLVYIQYTRSPDGREVIPFCDARLNGNVPKQLWP
ncbi:hypothetical protein D3C76_479710 [compost metagenome]